MLLDLDNVSDAVLLDVLNDVAPFIIERTGESREALGAASVIDGVVTFTTGADPFTLHRSDILTIRPLT